MEQHAARLKTALADRYRVDRELGAGGMATVYLARDVTHERRVPRTRIVGDPPRLDVRG